MNAFADWLFSTLFGWMGTAANSAWNAIVNASGGISDFFSKYWLIFVLIIVISGTVLDYAVWFARWRPYLVWRSWFTRNSKLRKHKRYAHDLEHADMDDDARSALADRVSTPQDVYPVSDQSSSYPPYDIDYGLAEPYAESQMVPFPPGQYFSSPYVSQESSKNQIDPDYNSPANWPQNNTDQFIYYQQPDISQAGWNQDNYAPVPNPFSQPGYEQGYESLVNSGIDSPAAYDQTYNQPSSLNELPPADNRRRRTERSKKSTAAKNLFSHLKERMGQSENQETMLDGLPSPVRPEDAFHEPIYPQSYHYQDTGRKEDN